ncbi:thioesterase family protein [Frankia sp. AiPs1]|uniref:PaaI family thioesterase n=1 Tax=Frankia sp. AiPs1 TaxID=573493 RepID=UPI002043D468|nr:acyl-CoA thioesterase domain-containing protein [Frankia sp. AiPs1]MCM3924880.1 thioesterase family protein [Frankia sp. AiPs1]
MTTTTERPEPPGARAREYAETRFRVLPPVHGDDGTRVRMRIGPWLAGPGGVPTVGSLGVVVDDAIGSTILRARLGDRHSVTSQLSLEVVVPPPWAGPELTAHATLLGRDAVGGLAAATVYDGDGRVVAVATGRCRYVPADILPPGGMRPPLPPADHTSLFDTLDLASASAPATAGAIPEQAPPAAEPMSAAEAMSAAGTAGAEAGGPALVLPSGPGMQNPHNTVHGGVLLCGSDLAVALADPDGPPHTTSVRISFLRPGDGNHPVTFTTRAVHRGRSLAVYEVSAGGPAGRPYTVATVIRER